MFKHFESCGLVLRHGGPCTCGSGMMLQIRTRADGGEVRVDSYCPVCVLRDVDAWRERLNECTRERDASVRAHGECIASYNKVERERDEARAEAAKNDAIATDYAQRLAGETVRCAEICNTYKIARDVWNEAIRERDEARRECVARTADVDHQKHIIRQLRETLAACQVERGNRLRERDEARAIYERYKQTLANTVMERDALKRDNASLTERLAIVAQERDEARALAESADAALTRALNAHDAGEASVKYGAWANGVCIVHGCYQIAVEKGGTPAICCPECTRADLERQRDRAQSRANCAERELKHARSERDDARKAADNAYNAGRDDAFETVDDNLCAWARHMIRNYPS